MPLMGYAGAGAWQIFNGKVIGRAMKAAENTGATCAFMGSSKRVKVGEGYTQRKDVHLDRMAAYLVAMNGDPNKPEVAAAQSYFAMQTRRAELGQAGGMTCQFSDVTKAINRPDLQRYSIE